MNGCKHPNRVTVCSWITHDIEGDDADPTGRTSERLRKVTSLRVCPECGHEQESTRSPRSAAYDLARQGVSW